MMKLQYDDNIDEAADAQYELAEMTGAIASRRTARRISHRHFGGEWCKLSVDLELQAHCDRRLIGNVTRQRDRHGTSTSAMAD